MKRVVIIAILAILIVLPLVFFAYSNWPRLQEELVRSKFLSGPTSDRQYSAEAKVPGYDVAIADARFLEYIAATMKLYDVNAIADPEIYFGNKLSTKRYTVSGLRFELVPTLVQYVVALGGSNDFATRGTYAVENGVLVVRVSVNEDEVAKSGQTGKSPTEDMFLDTAIQTLIYATGSPGQFMNPADIEKAQKAIRDNIPTGIFPRPIRIEKAQS